MKDATHDERTTSGDALRLGAFEDVLRARQLAARVATRLGFSAADRTRIATAVCEISRNVVQHAGAVGEVRVDAISERGRVGLRVVVRDEGTGVPDVEAALRVDAAASVLRRGAGLPSAKALMDDLAITSVIGGGTTVTMVKWLGDAGDRADPT